MHAAANHVLCLTGTQGCPRCLVRGQLEELGLGLELELELRLGRGAGEEDRTRRLFTMP